MIVISCPHCGSTDLIKFGTNRSGTPRCRCHGCGRTSTRSPKSRALTLDRTRPRQQRNQAHSQ